MRSRQHVFRYCVITATLLIVACSQGTDSIGYEVVYAIHPATWWEDGWTHYEVNASEGLTLVGTPFDFRLIDLTSGQEDSTEYRGGLNDVSSATFGVMGDLIRLGTLDEVSGWYQEGADGPVSLPLPPQAVPSWSPDGSIVAYFLRWQPGVFVGRPDGPEEFGTDGEVTSLVWSPVGDLVYALAVQPNGLSSLLRIELEDRTVTTMWSELDATPQFSSIGISSDGSKLYVALAGLLKPNPEARHEPDADRDMDIYELDVETRTVRRVVEGEGDDFHPVVVGQNLYWTHNELRDQVVVVPASGGEAMVVVEDAQIPYWSPDGKRLAYTFGGWRIADWALNLDVGYVDLDDSGERVSDPSPLVVGYHEDFTPAWSPDGSWLAYHSHRSRDAVASYYGEGSSDDIYLRRPSASFDEEIRLTDFGWEVGMADWAPDGTRLVFDSWDRNEPGFSKPWIATIDTSSGRLVSVERLPLPEGVSGTLFAAWSPTEDRIAFIGEIEQGRQALWVVRADGTEPQELVEFESSTYGGLDWMPDGGVIVYAALVDGGMQLRAIPRAGGHSEQLTHDPASLILPQVSPDGRWIASTRIIRANELRRMVLLPD